MVIPTGKVSTTEINLTSLPPETKRAVWSAIQADATALSELLTDETLRAVAQRFAGSISVERDQLPAGAIHALRKHAKDAA